MEKESERQNNINTQEVSDLKKYIKENSVNHQLPDSDQADVIGDKAEQNSKEDIGTLSVVGDAEPSTRSVRHSRRRKKQANQEIRGKKSNKGFFKDFAKDVAIAAAIAVLVMQFIKPTLVKQRSMQPNFYTNDYLFISKQSYKLFGGIPERGDVIVFESKLKDQEDESKMLIKRVIGVPGDVVDIHDGKVYINDEEIDDSYTKDKFTSGDIKDLIVPADSIFCLGDNRAVSIDSRYESVGLVPFKDVIGKVVFRLLPLNKFGVIHNPYKN